MKDFEGFIKNYATRDFIYFFAEKSIEIYKNQVEKLDEHLVCNITFPLNIIQHGFIHKQAKVMLSAWDIPNMAYEQLKASEQEYKGEKPVIKVFLLYESMTNTQMIVGSLPEIFEQDPRCYIMTIDDLEMLLATYKKDKSRFDDVVKALVENKRGGNDYKSVLEILNIYQAVGDMHFIGERDYFNKIAEKLKKELGTDQ